MIVDGSFYEKNVKKCGCCGPPPSLDYRVQFFDEENVPEELRNPNQFARVQNKMPIIVEHLLFSAVEAAKQQIIVMMDEDTRGNYRVFAKIM